MGTRADFYVGRGPTAEWIGSIAHDGHPSSFKKIIATETETAFRATVVEELESRDDATFPKDGWPWPWTDSGTSDFAYAFDDGGVYVLAYGHGWYTPKEYAADERPEKPKRDDLPDMTKVQNVTLGKHSGATILKVPK